MVCCSSSKLMRFCVALLEMSGTCDADFCDKVYIPKLKAQYRDLDKLTALMEREMKVKKKSPKFLTKKIINASRSSCSLMHCNPTCKDTIMTEKKDTPAMKKQFKEALNAFSGPKKDKIFVAKIATELKKLQRKTISKYKQPLKNGFYKGLSSADVVMLKKSGATSGCSMQLAMHLLDKTRKFGKIMIKMVKRTSKRR